MCEALGSVPRNIALSLLYSKTGKQTKPAWKWSTVLDSKLPWDMDSGKAVILTDPASFPFLLRCWHRLLTSKPFVSPVFNIWEDDTRMGVFMPYNNLSLSLTVSINSRVLLHCHARELVCQHVSVFDHSTQDRMTLEKGIEEVFSEIFNAFKMWGI